VDGQKMSKTLGNVIDPFVLVEKYGLPATRYYLAREVPMHDDGDYSDHRMRQLYTADLANELGNLLSRAVAIAAKDGISIKVNEIPNQVRDYTNTSLRGGTTKQSHFDYQNILVNIWTKVKEINKSFNEYEPWSKDVSTRATFMKETLQKLNQIGLALQPFLPDTAEVILQRTQGKIEKISPLFPRIEV